MSARARLFVCTIMASMTPYSVACAQSDQNTQNSAQAELSEGDTRDIVVTAQFREQSVQRTPLAITAISSALLQERGQTNIQQAADQIPSVTLKPTAASFGPGLVASIRGIGQYNFSPALEPGVGVFVDGVYYATLDSSMVDLVDIDRLEVLRGPQGTLTGRNSIGGAISIISKKPQGDNSGSIEATTGSRGLLGLRGTIDVGLTDKLALRISGVSKTQRGFVERLDFGCVNPGQGLPATRPASDCKLGNNLGGIGNQAIRGMLRYQPSDKVDLLLAAEYSREDHTGPAEVLIFAGLDNPITNPAPGVPLDSRFLCGKFCNYATYSSPAGHDGYIADPSSVDPMTKLDSWGVSGTANIELTDALKLTSITAFRKYVTTFGADGDLSPASSDLEGVYLAHRFFSQELRLNGEFGPLQYTVGGYYSSQHTLLQNFFDLRPFGIQYTTDNPVPASTAAAFATIIFPVNDQLTLTGGLRYTHEQKKYTYRQYKLDGTFNDPTLQGISSTAKDGIFDYRASIDYRWNDSVLTYATFSTGFKGGGVNPLPSTPTLALPFGPEKLKNYEIGVKSDFFDRRVRLNISAFYDDYSAIQETRLSCPELGITFCSLVVNAGNARTKGLEVEAFARPVDGLQIDASYSYLDFQFKKINPQTGIGLDFVPPFVPKTKWSAGIQYSIDMGTHGDLTPRLDAAYQSSVFSNAANAPTNRIPAYTVANASLKWQNNENDISVSLAVTNLFDKYYWLNNFDVIAFAGSNKAQIARPREFSISIRKGFR